MIFPPVHRAVEEGLLAWGGDLSPERLLLAYKSGIFPWYDEEGPILWFSPDPRWLLPPSTLLVSRRLKRTLRTTPFRVTLDVAFEKVIQNCRAMYRPDQDGTWITRDMVRAYCHLHELGFAHSVEVWLEQELVGGLYGVSLGGFFCGESMFHLQKDASKIGFVWLVRQLAAWEFDFLDCQMETAHLVRWGAVSWPRSRFVKALSRSAALQTRRGPWSFTADFSSTP